MRYFSVNFALKNVHTMCTFCIKVFKHRLKCLALFPCLDDMCLFGSACIVLKCHLMRRPYQEPIHVHPFKQTCLELDIIQYNSPPFSFHTTCTFFGASLDFILMNFLFRSTPRNDFIFYADRLVSQYSIVTLLIQNEQIFNLQTVLSNAFFTIRKTEW